ncbi:MAG TPA: hypothetical protein VMJ10_07585 [Kofleriaceae bacterium]|nr:hypothetical protein [Kofleriaceae bacterium]
MKLAWLLVAAAACGDNAAKCVPGEQRACGCPGDTAGAQVCESDGTFGACVGCAADAGVADAPLLACSAQTDCPLGLTCGLAHAGDTTPTCFHATYDTSPGAYGTSCALAECNQDPTPCKQGFQCLSAAPCDPGATCTAACTSDRDCPPAMFCDGTSLCRPRIACSPCIIDDECGPNARCATDPAGGRFCATTCASDSDCPQPVADNFTESMFPNPFEHCFADFGGHGSVCEPADGYCHGPSALASQGADQICSWCRAGEPGDCATGLVCGEGPSGERLCTESCTVSLSLGSDGTTITATGDTCPAGTYCWNGESFGGDLAGYCAGDPTYRFFTCYP